MHPWIIPAKITPPSEAPGYLPRSLWPAEGLPPVTLLLGGPGDGKSQAMLSLYQQSLAAGYTSLWLTCDDLDLDAVLLFEHLLAAVRQQMPSFGAELEALLGAAQKDLRVCWQIFFRELAAYNAQPGVVLFVDDLHHVQANVPDMLRALGFHFGRLPRGVHLVIASRQRLMLPLERLVADKTVRMVEPASLRFDRREAQRLWQELAGTSPPEQWEALVDTLEGWPLGVAQTIERWKNQASSTETWGPVMLGPPARAAEAGSLSDPARILRAVLDEVFDMQPEPVRAFMLRAACLSWLTPEACVNILAREDALEQLASLKNAHLIEQALDGSFRFAAFMRDYLLTEAARRMSREALDALHAVAGAYYTSAERPDLAFGHLMAARDWTQAVNLLRSEVPRLLLGGALNRVRAWLSDFPPPLQASGWVNFFWGLLAWRSGEPERAVSHWRLAQDAFAQEGNPGGELKAVLRLYTVAVTQQAADTGRLRAEVLARLEEFGADEDRADFWLAEALVADQQGDTALWKSSNEAVLALPVGTRIEVAQCAGVAHMNLFTLALHRGELNQASWHVEESLKLARVWGFRAEALYAGVLRAHLQILTDDLEPAVAFLRTLPASWEDVLDWHDRAGTLCVLGGMHLALGEYRPAEECLLRAVTLFEQAKFPLGKKLPLERLAWLAMQRDRPADALNWVAQAGEPDRTNVYDVAIRLVRARALTLLGQHREALRDLDLIAHDAAAMAAPLPAVRAALFAAAARLRAGDYPAGRAGLKAALDELERRGYTFLKRQDAQLWRDLASPEPEVGATPSPLLAVRLFGAFEARVADISLQNWPRRKAKVVLAALAMEPRGVTLQDLAELLRDQTPRQAGVHMAMTALRRALEPDLEDGARSRFLRLESERYALVAESLTACDVRDFVEGAKRGAAVKDSQPDQAAQAFTEALAAYRGSLLDEPFFEPYFLEEREGFRRRALEMLTWLHERYIFLGEESAARECLERLAAIAPCDEDGALLALRYYGLRREPARVRSVYWDYRKALHRQLGLAPAEDVERAYRQSLAQSGGT